MRGFWISLAIGAVSTAVISLPAFAQSPEIKPDRAAAIHECNVFASPFALYTWGNWQLYLYRECMAKYGQSE
jgi:hypothetical protein